MKDSADPPRLAGGVWSALVRLGDEFRQRTLRSAAMRSGPHTAEGLAFTELNLSDASDGGYYLSKMNMIVNVFERG